MLAVGDDEPQQRPRQWRNVVATILHMLSDSSSHCATAISHSAGPPFRRRSGLIEAELVNTLRVFRHPGSPASAVTGMMRQVKLNEPLNSPGLGWTRARGREMNRSSITAGYPQQKAPFRYRPAMLFDVYALDR
ncbi:unnamed protein product [Clonostachys chloroleuca]|uniref:Uncharacterized protein n=1 Tax=Clonostachys chloroleuca TaxID=1926264 RepID=A0AA35LPA1_9HYPO|nr:unnamed protein product [Clonostachys chloroleuca]